MPYSFIFILISLLCIVFYVNNYSKITKYFLAIICLIFLSSFFWGELSFDNFSINFLVFVSFILLIIVTGFYNLKKIYLAFFLLMISLLVYYLLVINDFTKCVCFSSFYALMLSSIIAIIYSKNIIEFLFINSLFYITSGIIEYFILISITNYAPILSIDSVITFSYSISYYLLLNGIMLIIKSIIKSKNDNKNSIKLDGDLL